MNECIKNRVHELYWRDDINCARTAIICLGELFETAIEQQTLWSAVGLHGAGGYRAQCGLVEGALMFIGIYLHVMGKTEDEIVSACYNFASAFEKTFGSLRCFELRPTGFSENDPPHMCENLTCKGVEFAYQYILKVKKSIPNKVTAGQGRAGIPGFPADWEIGEQREDVKVGMELYSLQELLKQYLDWGFDFASISIATQIPEEELRQLYSNENYRLRDKDKEKYLTVFLLQICCEKPDNDEYYKALLESLTQYFKIPLEAMANYIGVDIDELLDFGSSSDKDRIEKCIAHLFTTFIRDSSYSV